MTAATQQHELTRVEDDGERMPAGTGGNGRAENPMALLQLAVEKGVDPDQLGKLMDLQERWERSRAAEAFGRALSSFQKVCPVIKKTRKINLGGGEGPMYAGLDDIMRQISPLLADHDISITFSTDIVAVGEAHMLKAVCRLRHGAHVEDTSTTVPVPAQMRVNDTQKMGAAVSYAKRYALCAALNIVVSDEDNDGGGMIETITDEQAIQVREFVGQVVDDHARFWAYVSQAARRKITRAEDIPVAVLPKIMHDLRRKQAEKKAAHAGKESKS